MDLYNFFMQIDSEPKYSAKDLAKIKTISVPSKTKRAELRKKRKKR